MKIEILEKIFHKRELASLKTECDQLATTLHDLRSWADWVNLKLPELRMIKDALEHRLFKEVVYSLRKHWGLRKTYEELLETIKREIKKREML